MSSHQSDSHNNENTPREEYEDNYDTLSLEVDSLAGGSLATAFNIYNSSSPRPGSHIGRRAPRCARLKSSVNSASEAESIKSRAAPRKAYEPAPFLSIDNLPEEKRMNLRNGLNKGSVKCENMNVPSNTPAHCVRIGSAASSRTGLSCSSVEWNKMIPRRHHADNKRAIQSQSNMHVHNPFKQSTAANTVKSPQHLTMSPDQTLKEITVRATYEVAKTLARTAPEREKKIPGRLLKARWKPLNTVNVTGPTIKQCRGIVAGAHGYSASPNRTLLRRRELLSNINQDFLRKRPQTAESIHHTSVASENTERDDLDLLDSEIPEDESSSTMSSSKSAPHKNKSSNSWNATNEVAGDQDLDDPGIPDIMEQENNFMDSDDEQMRLESSKQSFTDSASIGRPKSSKSVRFADSSSNKPRSARNRVASAVSERSSSSQDSHSRSKSRSSCRPMQDQFPMNPKDDEPDYDASKGLPRTSSRSSYQGHQQHGQSHSSQGQDHHSQYQGRQSQGKLQPSQSLGHPSQGQHQSCISQTEHDDHVNIVRTSLGEVQFGFDDADIGGQRPTSQMGQRPRLTLGGWNDVMKPDECSDLMISGQGALMTERRIEYQPPQRTGGYIKSKRPYSAQSTYEAILQENRRLAQQRRPLSAHAEYLGLSCSLSSKPMLPKERPLSAKKPPGVHQPSEKKWIPREAFIEPSKRPRPSSSKIRSVIPEQSAKIVKKDISGLKCSYCEKKVENGIDFKSGSYFNVCQECQKQSKKKESRLSEDLAKPMVNLDFVAQQLAADIIEEAELSIQDEFLDELDNVDMPKSIMKYGRNREQGCTVIYNNDSANKENKNINCSAKFKEDEILFTLNDLEKSLDNVHNQIRECQRQVNISGSVSGLGIQDNSSYEVEDIVKVYQFMVQSHDHGDHVTSGHVMTYDVTMKSSIKDIEHRQYLTKSKLAELVLHSSITTTKKNLDGAGRNLLSRNTPNLHAPAGSMYYFAYGTDMDPDRFGRIIKRSNARTMWGLLFGLKLIASEAPDTQFWIPDLALDQHAAVEGSLQLITLEDLKLLDICIGYPERYSHVELPVWQLSSETEDLGLAQNCISATMFIAKDSWMN